GGLVMSRRVALLSLLLALSIARAQTPTQTPPPQTPPSQSPPSQILLPPVDRVSDRFALSPPNSVKLEGFLGERCRRNERARLLTRNEDELLSGFVSRPGKQAWTGEHVGKWLHASTLAWVYTGDPELRAKLDRVAAKLISTQQADGYLGT